MPSRTEGTLFESGLFDLLLRLRIDAHRLRGIVETSAPTCGSLVKGVVVAWSSDEQNLIDL